MTQTAEIPNTQFYAWKNYRCAYEHYSPDVGEDRHSTPLLLIHPIGVGLSRRFWHRFCNAWYQSGRTNPIYNPDLLGCGESDMPHIAYAPADWAAQLQHFLQTVIQKPVILVVQGALLPVALETVQLQTQPNLIQKLVLASPPAMALMTQPTGVRKQKFTWNLLDSPLGAAFYLYARRPQFLSSFSTRQLFANTEQVDSEWLDLLALGAANPASRHAVFSFLAGFWRQNYREAIAAITQPTLVIIGDRASSISRNKQDTPERRLADYLKCLPHGEGVKIAGRNVLPYESTSKFTATLAAFENTKLTAQ
ncbi:alpha/beta fold hydrolase [Chlorogloea sp. CCALA 695]|uniref:alpha/beta fold hydrolase n=1 Tax=Chlorogloea sp. CCALA 695 TaxID=2107693 RepID=UPI000D06F968|nr:alpha/beta hydrolase [Chlorogloea sp. CCALA 695]PSB27485.1 alpha/beta hydrolase [Chlorogloea sp. CCALA 695]